MSQNQIGTYNKRKDGLGDDDERRFYGKYRGIVTNNKDPLAQQRIKAIVPDVLGKRETGWALPCSPYAGINVGMFFLPPTMANVWIEFEKGDPDFPIWTGCFWGTNDVPPTLKNPLNAANLKVIKTMTSEITIDDSRPPSGEITLKLVSGQKVRISGTDMEINNNIVHIKLTPASVMINNGNLQVFP